MLPEHPPLLVSRAAHPEHPSFPSTRVVHVGDVAVGGASPAMIAGPCAVENRDQILTAARAVKAAGADILRGGCYKPRTSPRSFAGLGRRGLDLLADAGAETGLSIVTEVMDPRLVETVAGVADMLQIGSRSMQNLPLLREGHRPRMHRRLRQ